MKTQIIHSIEGARDNFSGGKNFEYELPAEPDALKSIQAMLRRSADLPEEGVFLNPADRVTLVRLSPEIAQLLAFSVSQKYRVCIRKNDGKFVLHFSKE